MARRTKEETERRYRRLLAAQARSGLSLRAFARKRGIPAGTLSYWRHELKRRDAARRREDGSRARFLPVKVVSPTEAHAATMVGYEVLLGRDCVLRLPRDFEVARVAALLKAVSTC